MAIAVLCFFSGVAVGMLIALWLVVRPIALGKDTKGIFPKRKDTLDIEGNDLWL